MEDEPGLVTTLALLLAKEGMSLDTPVLVDAVGVPSLEAAEMQLQTGKWDGVVLDLTLASSGPDETLAYAAMARHWPPFVVLTGSDNDEHRRVAFESGARGFFFKKNIPFNVGRILQSIVESIWSNKVWRRI